MGSAMAQHQLYDRYRRSTKLLPTAIVASLFAGAFILLSAWSAVAEIPILVHLKTSVKVDGESVLLKQLADIKADGHPHLDEIQSTVVGQAPLPGRSAYIHASQVESALKRNNIDTANYRIVAQGPVKVSRNHDIVSADRIKDVATNYIKSNAPWDSEQMKIRPIRYSQSHIVSPGEVTFQVIAPKHTDWIGAIPFKVNILVNGEVVKRTAVSCYIEVWQNVVTAAKPLGAKQPITIADIKVVRMNMARTPANAIVRMDQVVGKRANRSIAINSVLRSDQVDTTPIIRKGDMVQVLAESSNIKITTLAVAQENGGLGERIRLINVRSKKDIQALVIDSQTVQVDF